LSTATSSNSSQHHIMGVYNRAPLEVERGRGARLWARRTATEYLDCVAGIDQRGLGHAHPVLVEALKDQAEKLWHVSNIYTIPGRKCWPTSCARHLRRRGLLHQLGHRGDRVRPEDRAPLSRGPTAQPERIDIYGFDGSFHGRLRGGQRLGQPGYTGGLRSEDAGLPPAAWGDMEALKAARPDHGAIVIEPVQGEGGCAHPDEDLRWMRQMADEAGVLLIFDEVQCGMGRTGKLWAHEWAGMTPPGHHGVAKALGGGFPVGACLATERRRPAGMTAGVHGSTFGGNPLAMAVGQAAFGERSSPN
jgi:acetylornithine/N-succinyldiaminopimelate aminotransferase